MRISTFQKLGHPGKFQPRIFRRRAQIANSCATTLPRILCRQHLVESLFQGVHLVANRGVWVEGQVVHDPEGKFPPDCAVQISGPAYVSRAGYKLEAAVDYFGIDQLTQQASEPVAMDIGASVGGFTQCLLEYAGFSRVHTVEAQRGLLHPNLRSDPRVILYEGFDVRNLDQHHFPLRAQLIVIDVGSVPVLTILRHLAHFLAPSGLILAMVKPAFEFPGLMALIDFITRNKLGGKAFKLSFAPQFSPAVLENLCSKIGQMAYRQQMLKHRVTQNPFVLEKYFKRFMVGAKIFGFSCLGRVRSPVSIEGKRWEEFFLLKPDEDFYR